MKTHYVAPWVNIFIGFEQNGCLLASKIDGDMGGINTNGQGFSDLDYSGDGYNHEWDK